MNSERVVGVPFTVRRFLDNLLGLNKILTGFLVRHAKGDYCHS